MIDAIYTNEDLEKIARNQKKIIALILVLIVNSLFRLTIQSMSNLTLITSVVISIVGVLLVLDLAKSLKYFGWGYALCCMIPITIVSVLPMLLLSHKATKVLQRNGIMVGLMGARTKVKTPN